MDSIRSDIDADFEIREAIGAQVDVLTDRVMEGGAIQKTLRHWLVGHADPPEEEDEQHCLMGIAADLELFTPSRNGRTLVDRHLEANTAATPEERAAFNALGAAQFRLVKVVDRAGPDEIRLHDLVTEQELLLLDERISSMAAGLPAAMRLCPLESGRQVLISPLFALDAAMLERAMTSVRPGRPGLGHRCAANLYRDVARGRFRPMPQEPPSLDPDMLEDLLQHVVERLSPIQQLGLSWASGVEAESDLFDDARRLTSIDNLVDALGLFGQIGADGPLEIRAAYERIAAIQVETIGQRAKAGIGAAAAILGAVAAELDRHIAAGQMDPGARDLFNRLKLRWTALGTDRPSQKACAEKADIERVIQRIQALRLRTVDRGCTEAEAMEATAKISELLERHELTLDEISVRRSDCGGVNIATGRKRRAPVDSCMTPIAAFCDCRVWSEANEDGELRYVFFGLTADVEAARFLHDLIEVAFDTESETFKSGEIYRALRGGERRSALNSFQIGLAGGIASKLAALKAGRHSAKSTGFDLVAIKQSVLDAEISRLGLHFTAQHKSSRRYLHGEAYAAGKAAGSLFEPQAALKT